MKPLMRQLLLVLLALWAAVAATAAVPHEEAVPAYAEEQTILQREKDVPGPGWFDAASGKVHADRHWITPIGRPEQETAVILQRGGNSWRVLRNGPLSTASGVVLAGAALAILALWMLVGPAEPAPQTGQRIERFSRSQRIIHWATAITFVLLAVTGLLMLFGKLLIPLLGHALFSWLAIASKYVHNVAGPLFVLCSLAMFFAYVRDNLFDRSDWAWARSGGGLLGGAHPPAGYFNAGEKAWFWAGVVGLGLLMGATGLVLDFVVFGQTRYVLQVAHVLHLVGATLYTAASLGHIYLGTLGTPGAYEGMRHGTVDAGWARMHHSLWADRVEGRQ